MGKYKFNGTVTYHAKRGGLYRKYFASETVYMVTVVISEGIYVLKIVPERLTSVG